MSKRIVNLIEVFIISIIALLLNIKIYKFYKESNSIKAISYIINNNSNSYLVKKNYNNNTIGYIKIANLDINKAIMLGTNDKVLNKNVVGLYDKLSGLDDLYGNVLLAGHNNNYVFKNLFNIKINDIIEIGSKKAIYIYKVFEIKQIYKDDYSIFNEYEDKKVLTLVTCINKEKRFIVLAK